MALFILMFQAKEFLKEAGLEESLHRVRPGSVHVPHGQDQRAGAAGHPGEHEGRALAPVFW